MTLEQIKNHDISGMNVAILGPAASGKTFLSKQIGVGSHYKISTDEFISEGYAVAPYLAIDKCNSIIGKWMVEGMAVYRMLRKGAELSNWFPDIVIEVERSKAKRDEVYRLERDANKLRFIDQFQAGHVKVLNDYHTSVLPNEKPIWLYWDNVD